MEIFIVPVWKQRSGSHKEPPELLHSPCSENTAYLNKCSKLHFSDTVVGGCWQSLCNLITIKIQLNMFTFRPATCMSCTDSSSPLILFVVMPMAPRKPVVSIRGMAKCYLSFLLLPKKNPQKKKQPSTTSKQNMLCL